MAILAPIQRHIDAFALDDGYPSASIAACIERGDQAAPVLRALLQRAARGAPLSDTEASQFFVGLHVLAKLRDRESFLPLMRLLRRPIETIEDLLGDTLTASLSKIVASVYDGEPDDLFEIIADASFDEYLRDALWRAAATLVLEGRIDREVMVAFILRFDAERLAPKGDFAWVGWLAAIAFLGMDDTAKKVGAVWIDQRLPANAMERRHFNADLAVGLGEPKDIALLAHNGIGLVDDVAEVLKWADWGGAPKPIVNPMRDVGRNDPCPCGSGKKAKKCCLAAA